MDEQLIDELDRLFDAHRPGHDGTPSYWLPVAANDAADNCGGRASHADLFFAGDRGLRITLLTVPGRAGLRFALAPRIAAASAVEFDANTRIVTVEYLPDVATTAASIKALVDARAELASEYIGGEDGTSTLEDATPGLLVNQPGDAERAPFAGGLNGTCIGLRAGGAGTLAFRCVGDPDNTRSLTLKEGEFIKGRFVRVYDTGTSAAQIMAAIA